MRRQRRFRSLGTALTTMVLALGLAAPAAADEQHPVPYTFLPSAVAGGAMEDAPGSNDWDCRPTRKHPRPVVLVHGTFGNQSTNWQTYAPLLHNEGYCVFALTYGVNEDGGPPGEHFGGMERMQRSARELKRFVAKVLRATGAEQVDLVGHSQGTLMPHYWVKFLGGAPYVRRYVSLAPLWHGTRVSDHEQVAASGYGADPSTTYCKACPQMASGSRFMRKMRRGGVAVGGIDYTNIMTRYDQLVIPYTSGRERGMRNIVLQDDCDTDYSEHFQIAADRVATVHVLNALDPRHARPVPCTVVLPFVGP